MKFGKQSNSMSDKKRAGRARSFGVVNFLSYRNQRDVWTFSIRLAAARIPSDWHVLGFDAHN